MRTNIHLKFDAGNLPGGADAILTAVHFGAHEVEIDEYTIYERHINVRVTLSETDERVAEIIRVLAQYGQTPATWRNDVYTEEELQAAPLLIAYISPSANCFGGPRMGTAYDMSNACSHCGTGALQTSDFFVEAESLKKIKKYAVAGTHYQDILVTDKLAEQLVAANVRGLSLRKIFARMKDGSLLELPRKQLIAAHAMPPMQPTSLLNRQGECPVCHRGGVTPAFGEPRRFVYRREDLQNIDDVNVTWEWIGQIKKFEGEVSNALFPYPFFLVTPKVMNILRGKKKDEGVHFVPVWIEE